jgi:zinc transport system substrate-binding protein
MNKFIRIFDLSKFLSFFLLTGLCLFISLYASTENGRSRYVLVSVMPYKFFVEKIAGDTVQVGVMVPAGASIHTYEPTLKEMLMAGKADAWFITGESFEAKAIQAFKNHHPKMKILDLKDGVDLISRDPEYKIKAKVCSHCLDLHVWLSPKQAKIQGRRIADALIALYPEHSEKYKENLAFFLHQLELLDQDISTLLKPLKVRTILVSHPAYAYFCRDYNLTQLSIEHEGKDPTPLQLTYLLDQARKDHITTVFIQPQYNNKGARLIAEQINARLVSLDPYNSNYLDTMREIASRIAAQ